MNETKFDFTYFFETLVQQIMSLASNFPATYLSLLTVVVLYFFNVDNMIILYAALVVGVVLKFTLIFTSKSKTIQSQGFVIGVDLVAALLIVFLDGFIVEIVVLSLSVLYLIYYSYVMTISYTRLGHNTEELLHELRHRHEKQTKKSGTKKR